MCATPRAEFWDGDLRPTSLKLPRASALPFYFLHFLWVSPKCLIAPCPSTYCLKATRRGLGERNVFFQKFVNSLTLGNFLVGALVPEPRWQ